MSFFSYDYFKKLKRPDVYLAYPNKKIIGTLHTYDMQGDLMANSCHKVSFNVYKYEDNVYVRNYDDISIGKYVLLVGIAWFRIGEISVENEGKEEYKEVSATSLECELGQTYLTSFGSLGTDTDEQGGLDRYCLYSVSDQSHSILHIFLQKNPGWSIAYVDPDISTEYRSFDEDSIDSYSFLTDNVSDVYDCIFIFDSFNRSVSAYKLSNLGKETGICLKYRNVIKTIKMDSDEDDVKTVLTVSGGNDERTNTPLGIIDVNIGGSNQIYNFDYYTSMMSDELVAGLKKYKEKCEANSSSYQTKMTSLLSYYDELNTLKNKVADDENSTDWTQFGLVELQEKELIYKTNMSLYLGESDTDKTNYAKNTALHSAVEAEIKVRESEIEAKQAQIDNLISQINNLVVSLPDVLGSTLYAELNPFIREDTLTDDSFIVTNEMTDREINEMQQALLEHAEEELTKVCYPQFTMEVDLINFTVDYDYKRFTDALELFNIIHIDFDDRGTTIAARLLKLHINWDNPSDFKATFSNRNSLEESWALFEEVKNQAESTASKVDFSTGAWNKAATTSITVHDYINNVLNAAKQQLVSNDNNEIVIDSTGILAKKWIDEKNNYDPCQLWITNACIAMTTDSWNTVGLALGYIKVNNDYFFGLAADKVYGKLLMGEGLWIENSSGTYTINDNGMVASKDTYKVTINPNTASEIFSISISNKKLLYVDATNKKLKFEGDIESTSGHIANYTISSNDLISGKVGMSSTTTSGAIAFWAGSTDRNNAAFRVSNTGSVQASSLNITGGSITIGSNFKVDSSGNLTASNGNFKGTISGSTISGGTVSGTTITGGTISGTTISGTTITGGSITIGDNFAVDSSGNLTAKSGTFTGNISGSTIKGSTISGTTIEASTFESDIFYADDDRVEIGDFYVTDEEYGRGVFQSNDEVTGMSTGDVAKGELYLWAGYGQSSYGDAVFLVNTGQVHVGGKLFVNGVNILEAIQGGSSSCSCDDCDDDEGGCSSNSGSCSCNSTDDDDDSCSSNCTSVCTSDGCDIHCGSGYSWCSSQE